MTTILTVPVSLGDTKLEGQVAVLDIDGIRWSAPGRTRDWFRIDITAALPAEGQPETKDVRWLQKATYYVVAVFPEGTFDTAALPSTDERYEVVA